MNSITLIIPCYNEHPDVLKSTVSELETGLKSVAYEIIIIDDCSKKYRYDDITFSQNVHLVRHKINKGYGSALKTGILHSKYEWIGITDADGTYPNKDFNKLIEKAEGVEMVVGARSWKDISTLRRFPKYLLTCYAGFLAGYPVKDLNSGMRLFKKETAMEFWKLFPNRFSFTSTITMSCLTNGYEIEYVDIDYYKREGKSSIHPIKDTIRFFRLVTKLSLYFNPLRVFMPLSLFIIILAIIRGLRDYFLNGAFGGLALILFFMAFQVFFFGLLAHIISKTRNLKY
jgi:glycosyltransferase involved in cell wall biosynthesis